jgi:hypothetical protein
MKKVSEKKTACVISGKKERAAPNDMKQTRIDQLKEMIDDEAYVKEAIQKLAGSLTTGLMK